MTVGLVIGNSILNIVLGDLVAYNLKIKEGYNDLEYNYIKKEYKPPTFIFRLAWTILYIFLAVAVAYMSNEWMVMLYYIQLTMNFSWSIVFFGMKEKYLALALILAMIIITIVIMSYESFACYFLIPYIVWLCIALFLNISVKTQKPVEEPK